MPILTWSLGSHANQLAVLIEGGWSAIIVVGLEALLEFVALTFPRPIFRFASYAVAASFMAACSRR